jgi:hypothetical protein
MGSSPGNLLQKYREMMRTQVIGPFAGPYASGSYVHQAALSNAWLYCIGLCYLTFFKLKKNWNLVIVCDIYHNVYSPMSNGCMFK